MFSILFPFCQSGSRAPYNYCFSRFLLNTIFSFSSRLSRMGERGKEKAKKFDSRLSFLLSSVPQLFPYFLMPFSLLRFFKHGWYWTGLDQIGWDRSIPISSGELFFFHSAFSLNTEGGIKGIAGGGTRRN